METEKYQELFQLFCGTDEVRPELMQPFRLGDRYYATDAIALIFVPCESLEFELPFLEQDKPRADAVIPRGATMHVEIKISDIEAKLIPEMMDEIIVKEKVDDCDECEGEGQVEWEYGKHTMMHDCPYCDGEGSVSEETECKTGNKVANESKAYIMNEVAYEYKQLARMIKAAKIAGVDTIVKTCGDRLTASLFEYGNNITVLVMPCYVDEGNSTEIPVIL